MHEDRFTFNRAAIRPMECLWGGWGLIKQDYWLFLGIVFVGILVAELAPLGILMGPAMCGIHLCLLRQAHGQHVKFDMLFQGFNYFGQSFIAVLIMLGVLLPVILLYYVALIGGMIFLGGMPNPQGQGGPPDPWLFFAWIGACSLVLIMFSFVVSIGFFFVFPLIVDRQLTAIEAIRLSFRAAFANLGGVLMVMILEVLISLVGVLACYVGAFFVMPIGYAMITIAYMQVFPPLDLYKDMPPEPEPPAPVVLADKTAVQVKEPRATSVQETPPPAPPAP